MSLTNLLARVKVKDITKAPPSPHDLDIVNAIRKNDPPQTHSSVSALLSQVDAELATKIKAVNPPDESDSESSSNYDDESIRDENSDKSNSDSEDSTDFNEAKTKKYMSSDDEGVEGEGDEIPKQVKAGRRGNDDLRTEALTSPFMDVANLLSIPCNSNCCSDRKCTKKLPMHTILKERLNFFNPIDQPAPSEKEKAEKILKLLSEKSQKEPKNTLSFNLHGNKVCAAGLVRIIGLSNSVDISRAPGQFRRLMHGYLAGKTAVELLSSDSIKLDKGEKFTVIKGFMEACVTDLAEFYSDTLPTVKSESASTETKQLPYRSMADVYDEIVFQCKNANPPVPSSVYGSVNTFKKVFRKMKNLKKVQLLGGKSGFDTCAFCNNCIALRKKAAAQRDPQLMDIIRSLQRLHLKQQQIERQHCENWIHYAKTQSNEVGEPTRWFVEIDGMSLFKTNCPKLMKDRKHKHPQMENRLLGARIACGPIDQYIGICTSDLIPGGANVLIEATKIAIEMLADKLARLAKPIPLPAIGGLNYDNCGENKNKYMFAWLHHLIDSGYFRTIEMFFLFAGHTHSPIDQNFGVVNRAISRAEFIGSTVAMQELFKLAHDIANEKSKASRITEVVDMKIYHDYVSKYDPVINPLIHNFGGPHRYKVEFNDSWGISDSQYMWQSPETGYKNVWLPFRPPLEEDSEEVSADIAMNQFLSLGGQENMLTSLECSSSVQFGEILSTSSKNAQKQMNKMQVVTKVLPRLERLENESLIAQSLIYSREAEFGKGSVSSSSFKKLPKSLIEEMEAAMLKKNTKNYGYIRFIKRSLCKDEEWLDKRPHILPNPKLWREQTKGAAEVVEAATVLGDDEDLNQITEATFPSSDQIKKKEKKDPIRENAVTRLLHFNAGAKQMATVARYMLQLMENGELIDKVESMDIVTSTGTFQRAVITQREEIFYENIKTATSITQAQELLVAEEEARPWQLLRLPDLIGVEHRRAEVRKQQAELYAKKLASLSKLANKVYEGFDITREVLTRDGKETIFAKTLEEMTIDQLKIIISTAQVKGRSKFKTKPQLVEAIRKFLDENKDQTLRSLCGEDEEDVVPLLSTATSNTISQSANSDFSVTALATTAEVVSTTISTGINASNIPPGRSSNGETDLLQACDDTVGEPNTPIRVGAEEVLTDRSCAVATISTCPVTECEELADIECDHCKLKFCTVLHGLHTSHSCQQLKTGYSFGCAWIAPPETVDKEEAITINLIGRQKLQTSQIPSAPSAKLPPPPETHEIKNKDINAPSSLGKRKVNNEGETQVQNVANKIREMTTLEEPLKIEALKRLLNYNCYNVEFLNDLSNELNVDLSNALSVRRPTREGVMNALIMKI